MGFYNIMLEGEQAEAYKKKKADEEWYERTLGHSKEYMNRVYGKDFGGEKEKKDIIAALIPKQMIKALIMIIQQAL